MKSENIKGIMKTSRAFLEEKNRTREKA